MRRGLTAREREVLEHISSGQTNNAVARALGCTARTIEFHLANIYEKLAVASRTEAVAAAFRLGLLPSDRARREEVWDPVEGDRPISDRR